jgi:hypothetical protein
LFIRFRAMSASPAGHGLLHGTLGPMGGLSPRAFRRAECEPGWRYP